MGLAGRKLVPFFFSRTENLANRAQMRFMRPAFFLLGNLIRHRAFKLVKGTQLLDRTARRMAFGNEVQRVTHQTFRNVLRSLHQALHLQVDARAQALRVHPGGRTGLLQCFGEADRDPPKRTVLRHCLGALNRTHRFAHVF